MSSIVIVGGGVTGLACAWRLSRAGHDVEVLERESQPGGRLRGERRGEFRLDWGSQSFHDGDRNLHAVATALGLDTAIRPLGTPGFSTFRDGRFEACDCSSPRRLLRSSRLSSTAKLRLLWLGVELFRKRRWLDRLCPEQAAPLEHEGELRDVLPLVGSEALDALVEPVLQVLCNADIDDLVGVFPLLVLHGAWQGFAFRSLDGGVGRLVDALAKGIPVRVGCDVHTVHTESAGTRVSYRIAGRERTALADAAVVAVPGPLVSELCPKLTPAERGFFEGVRYARGITCQILLDEAPEVGPHYAVAFPSSTGLALGRLGLEHLKGGAVPKNAGLLSVELREAVLPQLWEASDQVVAQRVLEDLARTPLGRLSPRSTVVRRFPFCRPRFAPGSLGDLATWSQRRDRSPRLAFAGDYLVGPQIEGALTSGLRAASQVLSSIRSTI